MLNGDFGVAHRRDVYARNKQDDNEEEDEEQTKRTEEDVPFLFLGVDLPPMPLFKDTEGGNIIPQVGSRSLQSAAPAPHCVLPRHCVSTKSSVFGLPQLVSFCCFFTVLCKSQMS